MFCLHSAEKYYQIISSNRSFFFFPVFFLYKLVLRLNIYSYKYDPRKAEIFANISKDLIINVYIYIYLVNCCFILVEFFFFFISFRFKVNFVKIEQRKISNQRTLTSVLSRFLMCYYLGIHLTRFEWKKI